MPTRIGSMIALIQRVARARVLVGGAEIAGIGSGILALVCAERGDGAAEVEALVDKLRRVSCVC